MAKRLTEQHPLSQKVDKLFAFLEENNMSIIRAYDGVAILDTETDIMVSVKDLDDNTTIQDLPSNFEYKLIIED